MQRANSRGKKLGSQTNFFPNSTHSNSIWDTRDTQKLCDKKKDAFNESSKEFSVTTRKLRSIKAQNIVFQNDNSPLISRKNTYDNPPSSSV